MIPRDASGELVEFVSHELLNQHRLDGAKIDADTDLLGSGLIDSLSVMRLVQHIEDAYDVSIPPNDVTIENFMTIGRIVAYLASSGTAGGSAPAE